MNIAFDLDDTLVNGRTHVPNYDLIQVLFWFYHNGANVYVWSAGGIEYAERIVQKLGLEAYVHVAQKGGSYPTPHMDITFDDQQITTGRTNVQVFFVQPPSGE